MSKANANQPATKADINALKTDLNSLESKLHSEIQGVKSDLNSLESKLRSEMQGIKADINRQEDIAKANTIDILHIKDDIRDIRETMTTKADTNRVFNLLDAIAGDIKSYQRKDILRGDAVMRHEEQIAAHETRITLLEEKR